MHIKAWEELDITNDFLFGKVMRKPELCKQLLEKILNIKIDHIEYIETQKTIGIRDDAICAIKITICDLGMIL